MMKTYGNSYWGKNEDLGGKRKEKRENFLKKRVKDFKIAFFEVCTRPPHFCLPLKKMYLRYGGGDYLNAHGTTYIYPCLTLNADRKMLEEREELVKRKVGLSPHQGYILCVSTPLRLILLRPKMWLERLKKFITQRYAILWSFTPF